MFRINVSIFLLTLYICGEPLAFMTEITQSCDNSIIRLGDVSTILLDSILVELLFKINEDILTVKKTSYSRNTSSNHKTQNRSQSVKLGSNMNGLNHAILQRIDAIHLVHNRPANYEELTAFEVSGRRFVIAYYTFKNKISGFMRHCLVGLVYNSKVAFYSLMGTIRFLQHMSILVTTLIVRGPGF
jgi:hypothetical protein